MLKVGVTGGIGSGKSTVCNLFKCLEIPIFNADLAGRNVLATDLQVIKDVTSLFGEVIYINGIPDRKKIAELVFTDSKKLAKLNSIIHPAVRNKFDEWATEQKAPYIIYEAAIAFESGAYRQMNSTILVTAPEALRIKRIMQRDAMDEHAILDRMKNQWSDSEKKKLADFVIYNDDITPVLLQVMDIHNRLITQAR